MIAEAGLTPPYVDDVKQEQQTSLVVTAVITWYQPGAEVLDALRPAFTDAAILELIRHYTRLSRQNYAIDLGLFPLGSCTMKHNPRLNEKVARLQLAKLGVKLGRDVVINTSKAFGFEEETLRVGDLEATDRGLAVAASLLVLTTGRQFCERFSERLPVAILPCPVAFPPLVYYQLWHERTHASNAARWLREQIKSVAASLRRPEPEPA